jgi:hypothetical protein
MIAIFIGVFIGALGLVGGTAIYLAGRRQDRGFIQIAGQDAHVPAEYLPILVFLHPDLVETWGEAFRKAFEFWNSQTGLFLFQASYEVAFDGAVSGAGIVVVTPSNEDVAARFHTRLRVGTWGRIIASPIQVNAAWDGETRFMIAAHECGHCLGLDHDDFLDSVMYDYARPGSFRLTEKDRARVRAKYAPAST